MHAYRTHVVIVDPDHTVLKGLPFRVGQCVEVVLLEEAERFFNERFGDRYLREGVVAECCKKPCF